MPGDPSPPPSTPPVLSSSGGSTATTKLLIVVLIIAFAILASISFHFLRHYLSRRRTSSIPPLSLPRPPSSHTEQPTSTSASSPRPPSYKKEQIPSFPLVSLSSPSAVIPKSPDCAVCLSPFCPRDDLRLLPTCRHAFHLHCIDMWLQSTPSCPLCRSPAVPEEKPGPSNSFQVEIDLSYSFGSSVEQRVGEEVEAPVGRGDRVKEENGERGDDEVDGGGRGWLREYLDRVASSASSSFNSLAFSGRLSSHRYDSGPIESVAAGDGRSWDVEGVEWVEESGLAGIYRWFVGM